ncbi:MAG TPA: ATP-binding cassette domain-containing protein, partial [Polyangiaceae bacterium]|nr:ATP-binding cassette domain-containing protein [Polyangiaceae bacterium]
RQIDAPEDPSMRGSPLHEILNSMDGMLTPDGLKFIVTTNHLDRLDPAIVRPGRIDERGTNLSVGQRQLVAFARALYRDAPIVLLDEATASVDSTTEAKLQGALAELMKGRTALIIAHRLSTIRSADRIIVLHHGRIVEQGSHDELMHRRGLYAKLHALQLSRESAPTALTASHPSESYS